MKANINIKYGMWANRKYLVYYTDTLFVFVASYLLSQCAGTNINKQNPYYLENHTFSHVHKYYKNVNLFTSSYKVQTDSDYCTVQTVVCT